MKMNHLKQHEPSGYRTEARDGKKPVFYMRDYWVSEALEAHHDAVLLDVNFFST